VVGVDKKTQSRASAAWLAVLLLISGCASIDFDYPRTRSIAELDTADTYLGRSVTRLSASAEKDRAGFYPLGNGIDALSARLLLAETAERTIDTQYYLVKPDATGAAFLNALLRAADRGVRVRLLVDDMFAVGKDRGMAALDAHPNFEIRVVNPFRRGAGGFLWSGITDFSRVTRRMHAKSFTVDSQVTILGGRNIADEYFGAREDAKFGDIDVVGIGPVARDASTMFDSYWNHETALPLPAFADMPADPVAELEDVRTRLASVADANRKTKYAGAVMASVLEHIGGDGSEYEWAPYQLVHDSPDKHTRLGEAAADSINSPLAGALAAAKQEVIILTPYFVLRKAEAERLVELQKSGAQVIVITNSLAANNHAAVHGDYAPMRKPLLQGGVRIYEIRPDADVAGAEVAAAGDAKATLHAKAFFVDGKTSFIGSFNFNQRSINRDSESGVIIESETISRQFAEGIKSRLKDGAWELYLNGEGRVRWRGYDAGRETIYAKDPQSTWGQRFAATVARLLPIKNQL
jgi:putative cardiolipin synthase